MNGLVLHCGAREVNRQQLGLIETPKGTHSWKPVPHSEVAELITGRAKDNGLEIVEEKYGVTEDNNKMFGFLKFQKDGNPEYSKCLGFRNSSDRSIALGFSAGCVVLVCDNLAFSGEVIMKKKHTRNLVASDFVNRIFDTLDTRYENLDISIERLKDDKIGLDEARITICRAAEINAINSSDIIPILKEFQNPRHQEFKDPTRWSLMNSFTEIAGKKYRQPKIQYFHNRLASMFELNK
ncbi:MAG: DUF932 domain-containing protein [Victivallales bacterium]